MHRFPKMFALVLLAACATLRADSGVPENPAQRVLSADFNQVKGERDQCWRFCVGSEHSAALARPANMDQLTLVQREIHFNYVRCHGTLDDDMGVYREVDGKPVYSFDKLDALYAQLLSLHIRPFVELSFMPRDLARGSKTVFWYVVNVTQPKDFQKWSDLVSALATHMEQHFGGGEVRHWYFEVWNEPNHPAFWDKPKLADYLHLYDVSARAIKAVDPQLQVGGPATAGCGWVPEIIAHCNVQQVPLDFISTHTYAVKRLFDPDGKAKDFLSPNPNSIAGDVKRVRAQISKSAMPTLPLHFTEWSASSSSRDPVHDAYLSASFILDKVKKCEGVTQSMSYWTYSDLFEENGPPPTPFHGGFGLLNREGIRKASFFAYKYLNELGNEELENSDRSSWLCRQGNDFTALFWDASLPRQTTPNVIYFRELHPALPLPDVKLHITSLSPGAYRMEIHRTGFEANDAYSHYIAMGSPKTLTPPQLQQLQGDSADAPESTDPVTIGSDGVLDCAIPMRSNDVVFIKLLKQ